MRLVNIHMAKTHLSRLVEEVAAGEEIVIAKAGKPVARLVPLEAVGRRKELGLLKGQISLPDDFGALGERSPPGDKHEAIDGGAR
jgi:prevent-host-death family protein